MSQRDQAKSHWGGAYLPAQPCPTTPANDNQPQLKETLLECTVLALPAATSGQPAKHRSNSCGIQALLVMPCSTSTSRLSAEKIKHLSESRCLSFRDAPVRERVQGTPRPFCANRARGVHCVVRVKVRIQLKHRQP